MIARFVEGTMNVLKHHGIVAGPAGRTGRDTGVFIANSNFPVVATHGGFVELLVAPGEAVEAGQIVAIQYNTFGDVCRRIPERGGRPGHGPPPHRRDLRAGDS